MNECVELLAQENGMSDFERLAGLHFGTSDEGGALDFRQFGAVSDQFVEGYAKIAELGLPATSVAAAMMSATLNFYKMFDMTDQLPNMLRAMADVIEQRAGTS